MGQTWHRTMCDIWTAVWVAALTGGNPVMGLSPIHPPMIGVAVPREQA